MKDFEDVGEFHAKFGLANVNEDGVKPRLISQELIDFRVKFLQEELDELKAAYEANDLAKIADSLVDLVYVALGTAHLHGLPWGQLWAEVQRANMAKERALRAEDSARGSTYDVIKPQGWTPPDIDGVLKAEGMSNEFRSCIHPECGRPARLDSLWCEGCYSTPRAPNWKRLLGDR